MDAKTSWNIVKGVIAASVAVAVVVIAGSFTSDIPTTAVNSAPITPTVEVAKTTTTEKDAVAIHFIGECAQMNMTDPKVRMYAVSECVGRIRGFVDGHNITVAVAARAAGNQGAKAVRLFCVGPNVETEKLVAAVMDWAGDHVSEYTRVMAADPQDGATIIMIKALHDTYPCANT